MPHKDPAARREYMRKYNRRRYRDDPEHRRKVRQRNLAIRERYASEVRRLISDFRSLGCLLCGEVEHCCLTAHHLDHSTKDFNVGDAVRDGLSPRRVEAELAKCVCLCANCHAKVHAGVLQLGPDVLES